jgi:hypothetical protein
VDLERYRNELETVVEDAFSDVSLHDPLEEDIRKRLALIETRDTFERLDVEAVEETRSDVLEELDETFEDLALDRKRYQVGGSEELRGTTTEANILDGFGELGAEVQQKYRNIREYVEVSLDPEEILNVNIEAYRPFLMDKQRTPERLVEHFYDRITGNGMTPGDIEPENISEAIRDIYTEEEYRQEVAESLDPTRMLTELEPDLLDAFEEADEDREFVDTYLEKLGEFGSYAAEKVREVFPYDSPEDIFR